MKKLFSFLVTLIVVIICMCSAYADIIQPTVSVLPDETAGTYQLGLTEEEPPIQTLIAVSKNGFEFDGWYENGEKISSNSTERFDANRHRTLTAQFKPVSYSVTVSSSEGGSANISSPEHQSPYSYNETVTVVANNLPGYVFQNWTENGAVIPNAPYSYTFQVQANRNLVANFSKQPCVISAVPNDSQMGDVTGANTYPYGDTVELQATAKTGYHFVKWIENGEEVWPNPTYSFTASLDRSLVAIFAVDQPAEYTISAIPNDTTMGSAAGSDTYSEGESVTVRATAKPGYRFINWTEAGTEVSTSAMYTFPAERDRELVANFERNLTTYYTITYKPGTDCVGTAFPESWEVGTAYLAGQSFFKNNYTQTGWSLTQGGAKAYDLRQPITIDKNMDLYPYWTKNVGTLKLTVNYSGEGIVYLNGAKVTSGAVYDISELQSYTFQMTPNSKDYYVYSINFAGKYWNANVDTDKFMVTYDMMQAENRTLTIKFDSVTAHPKTGDDSNLLLWSCLCGLSAAAVTAGVILKKKSKS